jgi:hypothetical protein
MTEENTLKTQLQDLEARLKIVEGWILYLSKSSEAPVRTEATPKTSVASASPVPPKPQSDNSSWWLGAVAVLCFVLASVYFVKLSIDSGWLTLTRQLGLVFLGGASFIGTSLFLRGRDSQYAGYLAGTGLVVLYVGSYASHMYFSLVAPEVAMLLVVGCAAVAIWLRNIFETDFYLVSAAIGTYLVPGLLDLPYSESWDLAYTVLWSLVFSLLSIRLDSRLLSMISSYLGIGVAAALVLDRPDLHVAGAWALAAQFTFFAAGTALHSRFRDRALSPREAWAYFPVLLLFYGCEYSLLSKLFESGANWIALGFAALVLALYTWAKRSLKEESLASGTMINGFVSIAIYHALYLGIIAEPHRPLLLPLIFLGFLLLGQRFAGGGSWRSSSWMPFLAMLGLIAASEYLSLAFPIDRSDWSSWAIGVVAAGAMLACAIFRIDRKSQILSVVLTSAHLMAVLSLYRIASEHGSLAVSGAWALYSGSILGWGFVRRDQILAKSSLLVLAIAAFKVLIYDMSDSTPPVRIVCLLLTGALLYGSGLVLRRINTFAVKV